MQARSSNNAQGIDISHHNGTVDWAKVRADGISFAFLKASEGRSYRDPTFPGHLKAARAAGILVGAYHFVTAQSVDAAREEAANFMGAITAAGGIDLLDLPPVMDYENNPGQLTKAQINAVAESFLTTVESLSGRKPIIYTGNSFAANFGANLGAYPLWIARYSTTPPTDVAAWGKWTFWQYSDGQQGGARSDGSRSVAGVSGYVDLNEYAGTEVALRAAFGGQNDPQPVEEEVEDLQLSNYQWGTIEDKIQALLDSGKIKDKTWLEKAKARTLTVSDLLWLTFTIA